MSSCWTSSPTLPITEIQDALGIPTAMAAVECHASFGGVPRYWDLVRQRGYPSAMDALEALVFSPQGVLHDEAERVLRDEEAAALERSVCELVGRGANRPSELAARLGVKDTTLAKPLRHLVDLGLVERQAPCDFDTGRPLTGGRRSLYKLDDPFLAMWDACVRPNLSGLSLGAASALHRARQAWTHHAAAVWESVCRRRWHHLGFLGLQWEPAGRHWAGRGSSGSEWDVVSISLDRRHVFLGECQWVRSATRASVGKAVQAIGERPLPPLPGQPEIHRGLFLPAGQGPSLDVDGVTVLDAAQFLRW